VTARAAGTGWREAAELGILMNTRGRMELVILSIGLDIGVISSALFSMMVLMALVTTSHRQHLPAYAPRRRRAGSGKQKVGSRGNLEGEF